MKPTESASPDDIEDLPFETTSEVETTRKDVLYRMADQFLLAPFRIIWSDWRGKLGVTILMIYILMGTVGVWLIPEPTEDVFAARMVGVGTSWQYPLGTNTTGEGILNLVVHATPNMLKMVIAGGIFATLLGAAIGMVAGYKGGRTDYFLMLITDTMMTIPGLPLVMVIAFIVEPQNPYLIGIIVVINAWTGLARAIRSQMLPLRDIEYVESNRLMGISDSAIITKDIAPNLAPYIAVNFVTISRTVIFETVALYYLGILTFGNHWGRQIDTAFREGAVIGGTEALHWLLTPIVAVVGLAFAMILLAQAGDRLFNPRIRARHQKTTKSGGDGEEAADETTTTATR